MANEIGGVKWNYLLLSPTEDKSTSRSGVDPRFSYELAGIDGNCQSGLRPSSGFKNVYELDFLPATDHDLTSKVLDFYPIQFSIGSNGYAYGFVYRVLRSVSSGAILADIFVDYWNSRTASWTTGEIVAQAVDPETPWSRVAWGRFVYLLIKGRGSALFYVNPDTDALVKIGDDPAGSFPGPGKQPLLKSPEVAVPLSTFDETPTDDRPAAGQIVLCSVLPSASGMFPGPCGGYNEETVSESGSSGGACDCTNLTDDDVREIENGDYTFAYQLVDSETGRKSALSVIAQAREADFTELVDEGSDSGSEDDVYEPAPKYAVLELIYDSEKYDQAFVYRSVKVQDAGGTFTAAVLLLDRIVDLSCLQTNRNGAGLDFDPELTSFRHAAYWYYLEDKQLPFQDAYIEKSLFDEQMPKGGAAIMYENTLLVSNVGSPLVSTDDGNRPGDTLRGLGEIRWSSLADSQPELFAPSSRYVPSVPSVDLLRFQPAGSNIMGFSIGRQFFLRKDSTAIRVVEVHQGFGIVGPHAASTIGSTIWFVTPKGVKTVDASTQLDDIRALNHLIMDEWSPSSLKEVTVAFDSAPSSLFIYNRDEGKAAVVWFNTAKISEFHDLPFRQVQQGVWPVDTTDPSSELEERALWLQDYPRDDVEAAPTGWKPRIFLLDHRREKVITGLSADAGEPRLTLLDVEGDARYAVHTAFFAGTTLRLATSVTSAPGDGLEGAYLYVISTETTSLAGARAQIKRVVGSGVGYTDIELQADDAFDLTADGGLAVGDRVAISPVVVKWTGAPVASQNEDGTPFQGQDFFRVKHLDSVGLSFADVQGPPADDATTDAKFVAKAYSADEATPAAIAVVRSKSTGIEARSITLGSSIVYASFGTAGAGRTSTANRLGVDGQVLAPSVEIMCPDLDFRLMAASVTGSVRASARTSLP